MTVCLVCVHVRNGTCIRVGGCECVRLGVPVPVMFSHLAGKLNIISLHIAYNQTNTTSKALH